MSLITQLELTAPAYAGPVWHKTVLETLDDKLAKSAAFPCTFSQNAFARQLVRFIFLDAIDPPALTAAARQLEEYVKLSRTWDGRLSTAHPLVVAFSTEAVPPTMTVEEYHACAWKVLQFWHEIDPHPWPEDVGTDPHQPYWSMCFAGMQVFVNVSNPGHISRRSRNLGAHMLFIVNPRERFDIVAGNTPEGRKVRAQIRSRIESYDNLGHCLQLGSYAAGEIEWWQYGIIEENRERADRCPFQFVPKQGQGA